MRNCVVLLECGSEEKSKLWMAKVLLWCRRNVSGGNEEVEFALVQYMECSPPLDNVDKVLRCVSLQWSTNDDTDDTLAERS